MWEQGFEPGWCSPAPEFLLVEAISKVNTYCMSSNAPHSSILSGFHRLNCPETIWRGWSGWMFSFSNSKRINNVTKLLEWENALVHQVKVLQQYGLYAIESEHKIILLLDYLCLTPSNWLHFNYYLLFTLPSNSCFSNYLQIFQCSCNVSIWLYWKYVIYL